MVQQPPPRLASGIRNGLQACRNCGHSGQSDCAGIVRHCGFSRGYGKMGLFGHVSRRFARGLNVARPSLQHPVHTSRCGDGSIDDHYHAQINRFLTSSRAPPKPAGQFGTDLAHTSSKDTGPQYQRPCQSHECHCQRDFRDEPCSAVNPNIRARSGTVHLALRERRPSRHIILEALFAGSGLRSVVVLSLRERAQGRASRFTIPARMAAAAAAHRSAQAPPVLVVVSRQAGERLARPATHQDCGRDVPAPPAILHPRFRHRVLSRLRPVAIHISELNSASEHA